MLNSVDVFDMLTPRGSTVNQEATRSLLYVPSVQVYVVHAPEVVGNPWESETAWQRLCPLSKLRRTLKALTLSIGWRFMRMKSILQKTPPLRGALECPVMGGAAGCSPARATEMVTVAAVAEGTMGLIGNPRWPAWPSRLPGKILFFFFFWFLYSFI